MLVNTTAEIQLLMKGFGIQNPEVLALSVSESGVMLENCPTS